MGTKLCYKIYANKNNIKKGRKMFKLLKNLGKKEWLLALICLVLIVGQVWL